MENWKLIQQYISDNADQEQRKELELWMDRHSENEELVRQLEQIWEMSPEEEFDVDVQKAWEQFREKEKSRKKRVGYSARRHSKRLTYAFRAAAIILVTLFTGYFVQNTLTSNSDSKEASPFYVMQELITEEGEKARVTFSDGSEVILNAASELRFPKEFHGSTREVHLDGEAYFKVVHNAEHPFIVQSQNTRVQVLGTEFNVKGWKEDSHVDVTVREGRVSVSTSDSMRDQSGVILTKGELTRVHPQGEISSIEKVNVDNHLLWTRGGMHFDNVPFHQVISQLERKFNVEISVSDTTLMDVPFTSTFQQAELNEILNVIATTMEVNYIRDKSEIEFK